MQTYTIEPQSTGMVFVQIDGEDFGFWAEDEADAQREIAILSDPAQVAQVREIEDRLVTEDFCFVCSRCTDHRGEHSAQQILKAGAR